MPTGFSFLVGDLLFLFGTSQDLLMFGVLKFHSEYV